MSGTLAERAKCTISAAELEQACLKALRQVEGYEGLSLVEVRPSIKSRDGANWKVARIYPPAAPGTGRWAEFQSALADLKSRFSLAEV